MGLSSSGPLLYLKKKKKIAPSEYLFQLFCFLWSHNASMHASVLLFDAAIFFNGLVPVVIYGQHDVGSTRSFQVT